MHLIDLFCSFRNVLFFLVLIKITKNIFVALGTCHIFTLPPLSEADGGDANGKDLSSSGAGEEEDETRNKSSSLSFMKDVLVINSFVFGFVFVFFIIAKFNLFSMMLRLFLRFFFVVFWFLCFFKYCF